MQEAKPAPQLDAKLAAAEETKAGVNARPKVDFEDDQLSKAAGLL